MNCTIFSYEKTMGIRKLGGDNTEKKTNLQTYVQIMRIKKMTERRTSYDSNKNRQILLGQYYATTRRLYLSVSCF